jgi:hypothetical protein
MLRTVFRFLCGCLGLAMLAVNPGCNTASDDSVFSPPSDLGGGDGYSLGVGIGGSADRTISLPTGIPASNGFAVSARVRLAETTDPARFSEQLFDRGQDARIEDYWIDSRGNHSLLIRHRDPDTQREWIMLERIDRRTNEVREHLLARDKRIYCTGPIHSPAGEDFLLLRGNFLSEFKQGLALLPMTDSLPAMLDPKILPVPEDSALWIRYFGFSPAGAMILIWSHGQVFSGGASWVKGTLIARSDDKGLSWSDPLLMPDLPKEDAPMAYRISHDGSGTMHLFIATQTYENAAGSANRYIMKNLLHLSSSDNGKTWGQIDVTLPMAPVGAVYRGIAVDARGTINIIWSTDRIVYLARSFDRGATWSSWLPLELPGDWLLTGCEMILSEEGNIHLGIRACHPGPDDIYSRPENILFSYTRFDDD